MAGDERSRIHPDASIASTAVIDGDVEIDAGTCVLHGVKIVAHGAPVRIGKECVIMENAVVRGAGAHPCRLGDHVLIGPQAHVSGAAIDDGVFVATGAVVLNGARLESGTVVQVHAVVHIGTHCPAETLVPVGHVAMGRPARVMTPGEAVASGAVSAEIGFTQAVFGFNSDGWSSAAATAELCRRYSRALARHHRRSGD
jgi:gamma-carbonic anhydrase